MQRAMAPFVTVTTILFIASILQPPKGVSSNLWCYSCREVDETTESCNELDRCRESTALCGVTFNNVTKLRTYGCFTVTSPHDADNYVRICKAISLRNRVELLCACDTDCCNTWTEFGKGGPNENGCPTTTSATFNSTMDKKQEKLNSGAAKPKQKLLLISVIVLAATLPVASGS